MGGCLSSLKVAVDDEGKKKGAKLLGAARWK